LKKIGGVNVWRFCKKWARKIKEAFLQHDTPGRIASGAALGIFIGILPTMGLGIFIALFIAGVIKVNRLASIAAISFANPITAPFIIGTSVWIGSYVTGASFTPPSNLTEFLNLFIDWDVLLVRYLIGNILLATGVGICFGLVAYAIASTAQFIRNKKG